VEKVPLGPMGTSMKKQLELILTQSNPIIEENEEK